MTRLAPAFVVVLAVLAAWQAVSSAGGGYAISSPMQTAARLAALAATPRFWRDASQTGQAFAWALLLSMALGVILGVALGLSRATGEVVEPILVTFYALPKVTLYPLVLLAFGLGMSAQVAFGVMHGLVPVTLLTRNAIGQLSPTHLRTARVLRLTRAQIVRTVVLPAIMPELLAGIRIGFSLSLLGVLIGEMFAGRRGLGYAAITAMGLGDIATIMAIGLFLAVFAVAGNTALLALERAVRGAPA